MNGQPDRRGRERLLAVTVDELVRGGSRGRSLRGLAADVATSHRMLLYHFGSRQGVLEASMAALAAAQQALVADILNRCGAPEDCLRDLFGLLLDPQHGPGRMFLERPDVDASRGGSPAAGELSRVWLEAFHELYRRAGYPPATAHAAARAARALGRGLLLDLLVTGDRAAADAACEAFARIVAGPGPPGTDGPPRPGPPARATRR